MKVSREPSYSLEKMKELVRQGSFYQSTRVANYLRSHYKKVTPSEIARIVFSDLTELDFVKSVELINRPGTMADIYIGSDFDDVEWYVKAFIEEDELMVQIWSMCWDGVTH